MRCAWKELLAILPLWLRKDVDRLGRDIAQEIRLRQDAPPELVLAGRSQWLERKVTGEDLAFCVNAASRYSPWNAATAAKGYITAPGGHRIGLCGEAAAEGEDVRGIRRVTSLCIRVARDFPGIGRGAAETGSLLIIGAPGWGKTTLLRDLIRQVSDAGTHTAVVDERGELFPSAAGFPAGRCTDVLTGCGKADGIDMVLRTMGPACIAMDEVTAEADCQALIRAGWCGVRLLATAHAASTRELRSRPVYKPLADSGIFTAVLVMAPDKTYRMERMGA